MITDISLKLNEDKFEIHMDKKYSGIKLSLKLKEMDNIGEGIEP